MNKRERSATSSVPPPVGGADAWPPVGAPTPPIHDNPAPPKARAGARVYAAEMVLVDAAVRELRASTRLSEVLGSKLGTAQQIADAIEFAAGWHAEAEAGAVWTRYAQEQSNLSWDHALAMLHRLCGAYQSAAATDPAVEKELPTFTKLLAVRQSAGKKGAETRRRIKSGELEVASTRSSRATATPKAGGAAD